MNPIDFSQIPLRDIHLPGAVSWWPPAIGWWVVAVLLFAGCVVAWIHYRRHMRERAALRTLRSVLKALDGGREPARCLQQISLLMRRFAMSIADAAMPVAGLTGERWLAFLDSRWDRDAFTAGAGRALAVAPYLPAERVMYADVQELGGLCVQWIATQRPED